MSKKRLLSLLAAICGALVITARFATLYFPISAPAQEVVKGGDHLLHRGPIEYPADAIEKGIQGTVVVEATLDNKGVVTDARVISGPDPLRKAALKSPPPSVANPAPGHGLVTLSGRFLGSVRASSVPFVAPQIFQVALDAVICCFSQAF